MTGRKVKLAFIANSSDRKNTYKKRKRSLLKKTQELSILCGVEACAIVHSPYDPEPQIWPSDSGVRDVVEKFMSLPEWRRSKNMMGQESFIKQSTDKNKEKVKKVVKNNKEEEMTMFMFQLFSNSGRVEPHNNMTANDLNDLSSVIEQNLRKVSTRIETLKVNEMTPFQPQIQTPSYQTLMETPTPTPQAQTQTQSNQTPMQIPSYHTLMKTPMYQPQIQTLTPEVMTQYQPQMQVPAYQPLIQAPSYQSLMETPAYQPDMQTVTPDAMTLMNYGHGLDMNADFMQNPGSMDMLIGNGVEPIIPPFGCADFQSQSGFWPNLLP